MAAKQPVSVERGDHVYVAHPKRGVIAGRVLAHGKDGMTLKCDQGQKHKVDYQHYLGHKARVSPAVDVIDQGVDGAIVRDAFGRRKFVAGLQSEPPAEPAAAPAKKDDPLLDAAPMEKAMSTQPVILFLKAGTVANRPGLQLKDVTDKAGHQTKRWTKTTEDQPKGDEPGAADKPTMHHGQTVAFRHGDVQGTGKVVASGADGVTVQDETGREHQVRHQHLTGPHDPAAPGGEGQPSTPAAPDAGDKAQEANAGSEPLFDKHELDHLPAKAKQPFDNQKEIYAKSTEALGELKGWLDQGKGICSKLGYETMGNGMDGVDWSKPGGMLFIAPLKGEKRAAEKVEADYGGDWSQLKDVVRCSIAVDTMDDIKDVVEALKAGGMQLAQQPKDRFAKPLPEGYRDLMLSVKFANGTIGEVQVHLKAMLEAKEAGHKPYEVMRSIDAKPRDQWSPEDGQNWQAAFDQSKKIYGDAWSKVSGASGAGEPPDQAKPDGKPMQKSLMSEAEAWEYRDREGAIFRRPKGQPGGVTDVYHQKTSKWQPYEGDRLAAYMQSDECENPEMGGGDDGMRKALGPVVFLKANPTQGQIEAGNYRKGHRSFQGLPITVENPAGSVRSGVSRGGHRWSTTMKHDYGYIKGTLGSDGDHYDCYVGPHEDATHAYIVDTMKPPHFAEPDEQKAMLGFASEQHAKEGFLAHYDNPGFLGKITPMHMDEFKGKVRQTREPGHTGMLKAFGNKVAMFFKAIIPGGAQADLFAIQVPVKAHTTKDGTAVAAHTAIRHKKAPAPMSAEMIDSIAKAAEDHHAARKGMRSAPQSVSVAAALGGYAHSVGLKIHDDHELPIINRMMELRKMASATLAPQPGGDPRNVYPADEPVPAEHGLPEGSVFQAGRGQLGTGKWAVLLPRERFNTGLMPSKASAVSEARELVKRRASEAAHKADQDAKDRDLVVRLLNGGMADEQDVKRLGLRPGRAARLGEMTGIAERLFGISSRKAREAFGDAMSVGYSDGGTKIDYVSPRKGLANAARWAAKNATLPREVLDKVESAFGVKVSDDGKTVIAPKRELPKWVKIHPLSDEDFDVLKREVVKIAPGARVLRGMGNQRGLARIFAKPVKRDDGQMGAGNFTQEQSVGISHMLDQMGASDSLSATTHTHPSEGRHHFQGFFNVGRVETNLRKVVPALTVDRLLPPDPERDAREVAMGNETDAKHFADKQAAKAPAAEPAVSPEMKHFYVSAIDGSKRHLVAGPYASQQEAADHVEHVRKHADKQDGRAHFMAWGTAGSTEPMKTPLGENWKPETAVGAGDDEHSAAARKLYQDYAVLDQGNTKERAKILQRVRTLAAKTPADHKAVMTLDVVATRAGTMKPLQFAPASDAPAKAEPRIMLPVAKPKLTEGFIGHAGHSADDHHYTEIHPTREEAAAAALAARPKAKSASTSVARNGKNTHGNIYFHDRPYNPADDEDDE